MSDRMRFWAIVFVATITIIDIAAAASVRILANEVPSVAGDVAKVGIGILGGVVMMTRRQ